MPPPDPQAEAAKREECRYATLGYLYDRPALALSLNQVSQGIGREGLAFTPTEIHTALTFLAEQGFVQITNAKLGSSQFFKITADGQLAKERGI